MLKRSVPRKRDVALEPKVEESKTTPSERPPDPSPESAGEPGGVAGGVVGGVQGGVVAGVIGGVPGGTGTMALPFGAGMTRPQCTGGPPPQYTREAIAARVEGKVIVRCIITREGEVRDCKIIKGVPFLDDIVLATLKQTRCTPVTFQGRPETVQYLFPYNFRLP